MALTASQKASASKTLGEVSKALQSISNAQKAGMKVTSSTSQKSAEAYLASQKGQDIPAETGEIDAGIDQQIKDLNKSLSATVGNTPLEQPEVPTATTATANLQTINTPSLTPGGATVSVPGSSPQGGVISPYQQGLANWQSAGGAVPQSAGQGMAMASAMTPVSPQTSAVDLAFEQDPILQSITAAYADFLSPPKQSETLVSQYQKLVKSSGLNEINTQLLDTKRIIDGTEDDIRSEVAAASGFATDSQVLAMSAARNKSLITNYNNLLATKQSIENNINTMMSLSAQDKQMANERFDRQMNLGMKILEYRDKMVANSREAYNNIINSVGYKGLYDSLANDPYSLSVAEKTLGLPAGQLATLSRQPDLKRTLLEEQIATERAQRANIYSQISERQGLSIPGVLDDADIKDIDNSPQGKKVVSLADLKNKLTTYQSLVDQYGTSSFGSQKARLDSAYSELKIAYKTAADLGAIQAPDVPIIEGALRPATFSNALTQAFAKATGGGVGAIKAGLDQASQALNTSAATNISQLLSRNPNYRGADYVNSLIAPLTTSVTDVNQYDSARVGTILMNPDGSLVQKQSDGSFKEI